MMQVRATSNADFDAVDALLRASYPALLKADYSASILQAALPFISRAQPKLLACGTYYGIWTDEDGLVAAGGWTHDAPYGAGQELDTAHIRHVVTDYRMIRRAYGRALMTHIIGAARASEVPIYFDGCRILSKYGISR
ncbi:MAG: GNAT family N-acetyltransferase [Litoreibacter sp.]